MFSNVLVEFFQSPVFTPVRTTGNTNHHTCTRQRHPGAPSTTKNGTYRLTPFTPIMLPSRRRIGHRINLWAVLLPFLQVGSFNRHNLPIPQERERPDKPTPVARLTKRRTPRPVCIEFKLHLSITYRTPAQWLQGQRDTLQVLFPINTFLLHPHRVQNSTQEDAPIPIPVSSESTGAPHHGHLSIGLGGSVFLLCVFSFSTHLHRSHL